MEEKLLKLSYMADVISEYFFKERNHIPLESDKYEKAFKQAIRLSAEDHDLLENFIKERRNKWAIK